MSRVIKDFFKSANTESGYGIFEYDKAVNKNSEQDVVDFAMKVTKSQTRKWNRYGIIPVAFIAYLKKMDVLPEKLEISKGKRTITDLADLLFQTSYKSKVACGFGDYIREQILKYLYPDMHVMFGVGEKLEKDLYKLKNKLSLDKRQGYKGSRREVIKTK